MDRKLLVTLLRKDIHELDMITQGFMEMEVYPKAIIDLAAKKSNDISNYLLELSLVESQQPQSVESQTEDLTIFNADGSFQMNEYQAGISKSKVDIRELEMIVAEVEPIEPTLGVEFVDEDEVFKNVIAENLISEFNTEQVGLSDEQVVINLELSPVEISQTKEETVIEVEAQQEQADEFSTLSLKQLYVQTLNDKHSKLENSIGATLANKRIADIKQAISIGERFRFQRELFRGNGEDMNKSLTYINQLATFEEAVKFLHSKYSWIEEDVTVLDFLQIVRRRFL